MTITIDMPIEQYERFAELARRRGLSAEELARDELAGLVSREAAFEMAAHYVLAKNTDLYRRLAR